MQLFLKTLREPSEVHDVEELTDGFVIRRKQGRTAEFNALARRVVENEQEGAYAAFAEPDGHSGFEFVQIIPR